jgi:hypothetical protein
MATELSLFSDLDQQRLVQSFLSTLQATLPRFVFGDSIPVSFRPLKSNGNNSVNPWSEVDLTGKTVRIAIGNPAGAASSGTFTLTYDGDTTAAIAYNADGATIQTALNALASITAAGGVVVTRATTGAFRIVFNTAGARTDITADAAAIYPSAGVEIHVAVEGDGSLREIAVARIETLPAAYAELTDDFPVAASEIIEVRTGSGSVGAILSLGFSVLPYSGFYTLEIGGEQTLGIPWDADASTLQAALELLSSVGSGKVVVSGELPLFTLNFDLSLGDIGAMTIDMAGLVVPKGRAGLLSTNTAAMIELLNGSSQATAKLEIELYDIGDGTTWTVLQTDCVVIDDVIGNTPAVAPSFPSVIDYVRNNAVSCSMTVSGLTGGGSTKLDGVVTANLPIGTLFAAVHLGRYILVSGTYAEDSPEIIRPDDYHVTNNPKVWLLESCRGTSGLFTQTVFTPALGVTNGGGAFYILGNNVSSDRYCYAPDHAGTVAIFHQSNAVTPTTGNTITATRHLDQFHYLTPAGTLATLTLALPTAANSRDQQVQRIFSTQTITALTVTAGSGATMGGTALAAMVANTEYAFVYVQSALKWVRVK